MFGQMYKRIGGMAAGGGDATAGGAGPWRRVDAKRDADVAIQNSHQKNMCDRALFCKPVDLIVAQSAVEKATDDEPVLEVGFKLRVE